MRSLDLDSDKRIKIFQPLPFSSRHLPPRDQPVQGRTTQLCTEQSCLKREALVDAMWEEVKGQMSTHKLERLLGLNIFFSQSPATERPEWSGPKHRDLPPGNHHMAPDPWLQSQRNGDQTREKR